RITTRTRTPSVRFSLRARRLRGYCGSGAPPLRAGRGRPRVEDQHPAGPGVAEGCPAGDGERPGGERPEGGRARRAPGEVSRPRQGHRTAPPAAYLRIEDEKDEGGEGPLLPI